MSKMKILGGDIPAGTWVLESPIFSSKLILRRSLALGVDVPLTGNLERVEIQTEENVKTLAGTAGWGLAGLAVLGPLGAIGGMLIGGRGKDILFAAYLKDGRKFLASCDAATYKRLAALAF